MAAKDRIGKAGDAARAAQRNQYVRRLVEDEELRSNLIAAYGAARSAYGRMSNGKPATRALFEDRKLQRELREAVDAMRRSVAQRGTAGSTFDHVSREAGVSRGLLHYYFGTKEQLLVEAVRRDADVRLELLEHQLSTAQTADDFIDLMAQNLQKTVSEDPEFVTLVFELFTLSRRNEEIAAEYAGLMRRTREKVAAMLAAGP